MYGTAFEWFIEKGMHNELENDTYHCRMQLYLSGNCPQERTMELSLDETVKLAKLQSPDAQTARHSFRSAYWNYKYYRANYLPALSLTSDPNLNRAINKVTLGDVQP